MNKNMTEQQIKEKLKQIASFEPTQSSVRWMSQNVRSLIQDKKEKKPEIRGVLYYALSSAAMLIIGIGYLYYSSAFKPDAKPAISKQSGSTPTLAELHAVFQAGGQKALEEHLEKTESKRQPRAETMTLEEIMTELNRKETQNE